MKSNMISWFEIPVNNMDRAIGFYQQVFDIEISKVDFDGVVMGWFPHNHELPGAAGSLIQNDLYVPSKEGTLVYFNTEAILKELNRVEAAGGKILKDKTIISEEHGFHALILDTEGNRIAFYSRK